MPLFAQAVEPAVSVDHGASLSTVLLALVTGSGGAAIIALIREVSQQRAKSRELQTRMTAEGRAAELAANQPVIAALFAEVQQARVDHAAMTAAERADCAQERADYRKTIATIVDRLSVELRGLAGVVRANTEATERQVAVGEKQVAATAEQVAISSALRDAVERSRSKKPPADGQSDSGILAKPT